MKGPGRTHNYIFKVGNEKLIKGNVFLPNLYLKCRTSLRQKVVEVKYVVGLKRVAIF